MITTYQEAREYLESFIRPSTYKKLAHHDPHAIDMLGRAKVFLELLGNPQNHLKAVQVSGTSGKTSTSYLIAHILSTAGYKTGLTISPHLESLTERLQINGEPVKEKQFITLLNKVIPLIHQMKNTAYGEPSYYEILLGIAFLYFKKEKVDIVVAEVGLEGKFDMTNHLHPLVAVVTTISLDHTELLGNTVEKIAEEAVSMIKDLSDQSTQQQVITAVTKPSVLQIIEKKCEEKNAVLRCLKKDFSYSTVTTSLSGSKFDFISGTYNLRNIELALVGQYQILNAAIALEVIQKLTERGFVVPEFAVRQAFTSIRVPGRFERILVGGRTFILDGAHNTEKMDSFVTSLTEYYPETAKTFIIAFKKDKDRKELLSKLLPAATRIIVTAFQGLTDMAKNPATNPKILYEQLRTISSTTPVVVAQTLNHAIALATHDSEGELIVITGSLYLVGEARTQLRKMAIEMPR